MILLVRNINKLFRTCIRSKRGSAFVYAGLICSTIIGIMTLSMSMAIDKSNKSMVRSLSKTTCISILSEYDLFLKYEYDILGFYGDEMELEKKVDYYMNQSFREKGSVDYKESKVSVMEYRLSDLENFKESIVRAGKYGTMENLLKNKTEPNENRKEMRYLERKTYRVNFSKLPSHSYNNKSDIPEIIRTLTNSKDIKDIIKKGTDVYFVNQYILDHFSSFSEHLGRTSQDKYFKGEIEYILAGRETDEANKAQLKLKIIAIREAINLIYLNSDKAKYSAAMVIAQGLTPGPLAIVTCQGILASWAALESLNDYEILIRGGKVPLIKTSKTWAVDIESAISNKSQGYIDNKATEGMTYEDYLKTLLYIQDEDVTLLRTMDLIEIDGKRRYWEDFEIGNYSIGVGLLIRFNNRELRISDEY